MNQHILKTIAALQMVPSYSKSNLSEVATDSYQAIVGSGKEDVLQAYIDIRAAIETLSELADDLKPYAIDEVGRFSKDDSAYMAASFQVKESTRYVPPKLETLDALANERKRIERLAKTAYEMGAEYIVDPETGEEIPAATKVSTTTIAVTFPKG